MKILKIIVKGINNDLRKKNKSNLEEKKIFTNDGNQNDIIINNITKLKESIKMSDQQIEMKEV